MRGSHLLVSNLACVVALAGVAAAGELDFPSFPAVPPGEEASLALKVYANPGVSGFVNQSGDGSVERGGFENTGSGGAYGNYNVMASWDEFVGTGSNIVQVIWKTSTGQRFFPPGATVGGLPIQFLEWRLGASDPVGFGPWVSGNSLVAATISSSVNGGASFQNFDITASISNPWNGTAVGTTLPISFFNLANYIQLTIEYTPVPAPGVVTVLAGAGFLACRRRRR
ncbi:MAG: hypothetical protein IT437_14130 [Phycisphaerales bacterium]|nr:hypothetical protein [Phycisphaerales bacterium]